MYDVGGLVATASKAIIEENFGLVVGLIDWVVDGIVVGLKVGTADGDIEGKYVGDVLPMMLLGLEF